MKKALTVALLFVMIMTVAMTVVNAATMATKDTLASEVYAIGSKYGMTAEQKRQVEIILANRDLDDYECDKILTYAKSAAQIMDDNGLKSYEDLKNASADIKAELRTLANSAADYAGVTLKFTADGIVVIDSETGKTLTTFTDPSKAPYTGSNSILVISSVVAIALVAAVVTKRTLVANA